MRAYNESSICYQADPVSRVELVDEPLTDEDFADDLIDAINQTFILEVVAGRLVAGDVQSSELTRNLS